MASTHAAEDSASAPVIAPSLDGGGAHGYAQLIWLEEIMTRLEYELAQLQQIQGQRQEVRFSECFDLVGGVGCGGIVALLLGRLELGIQDAKIQFGKLIKATYSGPSDNPAKRTQKFQDKMKTIVASTSGVGDQNALMGTQEDCKTFVCTQSTFGHRATKFRSYRARGRKAEENVSIWEAAQATYADFQEFRPFKSGPHVSSSYGSPSLVCNNPAVLVREELKSLFPTKKHIILSVGSGPRTSRRIATMNVRDEEYLKQLAENTEKVTEELHRSHRDDPTFIEFFTLNVDEDLHDAKDLAPVEQMLMANSISKSHLQSTQASKLIDKCVSAILWKMTGVRCSSRKAAEVPQDINYIELLNDMGSKHNLRLFFEEEDKENFSARREYVCLACFEDKDQTPSISGETLRTREGVVNNAKAMAESRITAENASAKNFYLAMLDAFALK